MLFAVPLWTLLSVFSLNLTLSLSSPHATALRLTRRLVSWVLSRRVLAQFARSAGCELALSQSWVRAASASLAGTSSLS
jgi:hypothetical protein